MIHVLKLVNIIYILTYITFNSRYTDQIYHNGISMHQSEPKMLFSFENVGDPSTMVFSQCVFVVVLLSTSLSEWTDISQPRC